MYKSFTSKAIFPWSGRWRRAVRFRGEEGEKYLLSILVQNAMLFGQKYPPPPTLTLEIRRDAWCVNPTQMSIIQVRKKRPEVLRDGCTVPIKHTISPYICLLYFWFTAKSRNCFSKGDTEQFLKTFFKSALHQCPLSCQALLLPRSATSPQWYMQIRSR